MNEGDILSMIMALWLCFQKGVSVNGKTVFFFFKNLHLVNGIVPM